MRIAVLGASGRTGGEVLIAGRGRGHRMVPVVRRPGSGGEGERIADGRDADALRVALADIDAAVFTIGPTPATPDPAVMRDSAAATLTALPSGARLAVVTASGPFVAGDDPPTRFLAKPILRRVFREAWADIAATDRLVAASDAAWTIARPPMLQDGPARGRYRERRDGNVRWGFALRRADLAVALLDALDDPTTVHAVVSYAN